MFNDDDFNELIDALDSITAMFHNDEEDYDEGRYVGSCELNKLAEGLTQRHEAFDRKRIFDGEQIRCDDDDWDAVIHCGSYGHEDGLLEIMYPNGEVEGYLTADEILNWLDEYKKWVK